MSRDTTNLTVTITGVAALTVLIGVIWFGLGASPSLPVTEVTPHAGEESVKLVRVHISGAVVTPGVVELPLGSLVADAVSAAGGVVGSADLAAINLAADVRAGERIVVPEIRKESAVSATTTDQGIDLNTATASDLETLPGVGPVLSERIVAYREIHGFFVTVEDLLGISGIGESKLASMRDAISYP